MTNTYQESYLAYEVQVQELSRAITSAYNADNFTEAARLVKKQDQAVADMNYFIGLHLKNLKES